MLRLCSHTYHNDATFNRNFCKNKCIFRKLLRPQIVAQLMMVNRKQKSQLTCNKAAIVKMLTSNKWNIKQKIGEALDAIFSLPSVGLLVSVDLQ